MESLCGGIRGAGKPARKEKVAKATEEGAQKTKKKGRIKRGGCRNRRRRRGLLPRMKKVEEEKMVGGEDK